MIVTRRRFLQGSATIAVASAVIAKAGLPKLLTPPVTKVESTGLSYDYSLGLLDFNGNELPWGKGYDRKSLDCRFEAVRDEYDQIVSQHARLVNPDGSGQFVWHCLEDWPVVVYGMGVFLRHLTEPICKLDCQRGLSGGMRMTRGGGIAPNTLTAAFGDRPVAVIT